MGVVGPQLFIITHSGSQEYFSSIIRNLTDGISNNIGSNKNGINYKIIASKDEFENLIRLDFTKAVPLFFLITVETNWTESEFGGYQLALELMEHPDFKEKKLNLYFTSFLSRKDLFDLCENRVKMLPKSFPHFQLPYRDEALPQMKPLLESKWNYLRKFSLTESGILDMLKHKLDKDITQERASEIVDFINGIPDVVGEEVIGFVNKLDKENLLNNINELRNKIIERKEWLQPSRINPSNLTFKWKPNLVIIEDDDEFQKRLKGIFNEHFELKLFSSGEKAIDYLSENSFEVNAILCDLELLNENNIDQAVQGIEVIDYVKNNFPHIALKVITHLPRLGVWELLKSIDIEYDDLVYKTFLESHNENYVRELILDINKKIKESAFYKHLKGPSNTLWTHTTPREKSSEPGRLKWFYYKFKQEDPEEFKRMWESIDNYLEDVKKRERKIDYSLGKAADLKKIFQWEKSKAVNTLKKLLIDRMFWIQEYYMGLQKQDIDIKQKEQFFGKNRIPFNKNKKRYSIYGMLTGISFIEKLDYVTLYFGQLFEEELNRLHSESVENLDLPNAYISEQLVDIIEYVNKKGERFFTGDYIPTSKFVELWLNGDLEMKHIKEVLYQINKERPTVSFDDPVRVGNNREKIITCLLELNDKESKNKNEYNLYDRETKKLLKQALETVNY